MSRYNRHRRDANHADIVEALRCCGCSVRDTSQLGDKGGDIVIGFSGRDFGAEIKIEGEDPTDEQREFAREWKGAPPVIFRSVLEAVQWVNEQRLIA